MREFMIKFVDKLGTVHNLLRVPEKNRGLVVGAYTYFITDRLVFSEEVTPIYNFGGFNVTAATFVPHFAQKLAKDLHSQTRLARFQNARRLRRAA